MKTHHTHAKKLNILQEHLIAFVVAFFIVVGVAGGLFYRDTLFADITGGSKAETTNLPIVYEIKDGNLTISTSRTFQDATSMTFFVVFDPKNVLIQLEKAKSPYEFTFAPGLETMVQVTVMTKGTVAENTTIFSVPVNGSADKVTISNAGVLRNKGSYEMVAIQKK